MKVIAVANSKGGVGKTTTCVSVGHALAQMALRVLLVDLDSQGHVAVSLGLPRSGGLYRAMIGGAPVCECTIPSGRELLDVLPGDKSTAGVRMALAGEDYREQRLVKMLRPLADVYDVVLLDCGPTLDILNVNAIHAASEFILPLKCDYLAVDGLSEYINSLKAHLDAGGRSLAGRVTIVPTLFDQATNETRRWLVEIQQFGAANGVRVSSPIPAETRVREATSDGKTIWEADCPRAQVAYTAMVSQMFEVSR